jgi:hypothetical protein
MTIENDAGEFGLIISASSGGGGGAYHQFITSPTDGSVDNSFFIYGRKPDDNTNHDLGLGYNAFSTPAEYFLQTIAQVGASSTPPFRLQFQEPGGSLTNMLSVEDDNSVILSCGELRGADDAVADATDAQSVTSRAGDKGAGTGDGGDYTSRAGDSSGGDGGDYFIRAGAASGAGNGGNTYIDLAAGTTEGSLIVRDSSLVSQFEIQPSGRTFYRKTLFAGTPGNSGQLELGEDSSNHFVLLTTFTGDAICSFSGIVAGGTQSIWSANRTQSTFEFGNQYSVKFKNDIGFFSTTPVSQEADTVALTDSSGGTADNTIAAVSGSGADSDINNNFADLAAKYNALRDLLRSYGLMA